MRNRFVDGGRAERVAGKRCKTGEFPSPVHRAMRSRNHALQAVPTPRRRGDSCWGIPVSRCENSMSLAAGFRFRSTHRKPERCVMFRSERRWNGSRVKDACPDGAPICLSFELSQSLCRSNRARVPCVHPQMPQRFSGRIELQTQSFIARNPGLRQEQLEHFACELFCPVGHSRELDSLWATDQNVGRCVERASAHLLIIYARLLWSVIETGRILVHFRRHFFECARCSLASDSALALHSVSPSLSKLVPMIESTGLIRLPMLPQNLPWAKA